MLVRWSEGYNFFQWVDPRAMLVRWSEGYNFFFINGQKGIMFVMFQRVRSSTLCVGLSRNVGHTLCWSSILCDGDPRVMAEQKNIMRGHGILTTTCLLV
jgi:hypothetical protein